jgi:hypothetical protein
MSEGLRKRLQAFRARLAAGETIADQAIRRAAAALVAAAPDLIGLVGGLMVCRGVWLLWGEAITWLVAGAPIVLLYVWREMREMRRPKAPRAIEEVSD